MAGAIGYAIPAFILRDDDAAVDPAHVAALETQIDALRSEVSAAGSAVAADVDLAPVQGLIDQLAARLDAVESTPVGETVDLAPLRTELDALRGEVGPLGGVAQGLQGEVTGFADALTALSNEVAVLSGVPDVVSGVSQDVSALSQDLATVSGRVDALGATVEGVSSEFSAVRDAVSGLPSDFDTLRDDIQARMADVEAQVASLTETARDVEAEAEVQSREAARNQLRLAVESGGVGYVEPLDVLGGDVPDGLSASSDVGVPSHTSLQEDFPARARAALRDARRLGATEGGVGGLIARVTNARSLKPREGDDPDAVLARAEAALRDGDLETALSEVQVLPTEAQAAFGDWLSRARARLAAMRALPDYLSTSG